MARTKLSPEERRAYEEARNERIRQAGTLGGQTTAARYGREYMRLIGKAGFQAYADNHHDGNRAAARAALTRMKQKPRQGLNSRQLADLRTFCDEIPY
jgi:creatinine amidohydrolase/Fe(II)-dependent formamide hydrolase-like protein